MHTTRRTQWCLLMLALLGLAGSALAATAEDLEFRIPSVVSTTLNAQQGPWALREVVLVNHAGQPRTVRVAYPSSDPARGQIDYSRVVELAPRSRRMVILPVRPMSLEITSPGGRTGRPKANESMLLYDHATNRQLTRENRIVNVIPDEDTIVVYASSPHARITNDSETYLDELASQPLGPITRLSLRIERAPDRWYGYDAADIMILGPADLTRVRPSQLRAILDWTGRGGVLVLTGSRQLPELLNGPFGPAAGVASAGVHEITQLQARDLGPAGSQLEPVELPAPLPMVELVPDRAEVLYEANSLPLLTRKAFGQGHVLTLAVPVGALSHSRLHEVWHPVGATQRIAPEIDPAAFAAHSPETLVEIAGRRGPSRGMPAGLLAAMAGFVVVAGLVARWKRRGEWVWWVLVPAAIVASVGLFVMGRGQASDDYTSYVGLVTQIDQDSCRIQQTSMVYNGQDAQREMTFRTASPLGLIDPLGEASAAVMSRTEIRFGDQTSLPNQTVPANGTSAFDIDAVRPLRPVSGQLTFDATGLTGTLTNHLPADLTDAVLYAGRNTYRVGTLPAGQATEVTVAPADWLGPVTFTEITRENGRGPARREASGEFTVSLVHQRSDTLRNNLLANLLSIPESRLEVLCRPVLIGYVDWSPTQPVADADLPRQGWSVVIVHLQPQPAPTGERVLIPAGLVRTDLRDMGSGLYAAIKEQFQLHYGKGELLISAREPTGLAALKDASATVRILPRATAYRLELFGVRGGKADYAPADLVPLGSWDHLSELAELSVPDVARFRDGDGPVRMVLRGSPLFDPRDIDITNRPKWTVKRLEVQLEGTAP